MNTSDFIHPDDAAALETLKSIPVLSTIVKKFMDVGAEQLQAGLNLASKVRLSPTQLPKLYYVLPPICEQLGIEEPDFFLEMHPIPNAYAFGDTQTAITITSSLVEMMSEEELIAVVAHECGHIACHHMLYHTLAQILANTTGLFEALATLAKPIQYALMYWQRKSELSCDRAALYVAGPIVTTSMLARLAGGPKTVTSELNLEDLAEQADKYDAFRKNGLWNKTLQTYAILDQDHPFLSDRIREVLRWTVSEQYRNLMRDYSYCPNCHLPILNDCAFCHHCGKKNKKI